MISEKKKNRKNIKKLILLLLLGGLALGLTHSPKKYFEILGEISNELKGIKKSNLKRTLKILHGRGLLKEEINLNGTIRIILSEAGKKLAESYSIDDLVIKKPKRWDGNWRIVIFDIPEPIKKVREALRMHLRNLGFYELQKSVFVLPFPCIEEIDKIVKFYAVRKYVRLITANSIDNEDELIEKFKI